jgi:hypothetical protein
MKTLNDNQVQEEVFSLLMQQLEPWKVAHFWAISRLGSGDCIKAKYDCPDIESFDDLVREILIYQDQSPERG